DPYLEGREAALAPKNPEDGTIFGLFAKIAGAIAVLAIVKFAIHSSRASSVTNPTPVPAPAPAPATARASNVAVLRGPAPAAPAPAAPKAETTAAPARGLRRRDPETTRPPQKTLPPAGPMPVAAAGNTSGNDAVMAGLMANLGVTPSAAPNPAAGTTTLSPR